VAADTPSQAHQRLADRGLTLPPVAAPAAAYQPWARHGDLIHTAGQLPMRDGALAGTGRLGDAHDTAAGAAFAQLTALGILAIGAAVADGDLDRIRVVELTVYVASTPDFHEQHLVANGASELLGDVLGEAGVHARSAVGVAVLPLDAPVEASARLALR
jgi:enamine deaminase RidA (YjgF/YER057c/UK114 family)